MRCDKPLTQKQDLRIKHNFKYLFKEDKLSFHTTSLIWSDWKGLDSVTYDKS